MSKKILQGIKENDNRIHIYTKENTGNSKKLSKKDIFSFLNDFNK